MRKSETIKIDNKEVEIKELRVKDVYKFGSRLAGQKDNLGVKEVRDIVEEVLPEVSNLSADELLELSFSDLDALEEAFWKVNKSFLKRLDQLGIKSNLKKAFSNITQETNL